MADERISLRDIAGSVDADIAAMRARMPGAAKDVQFSPKVLEAVALLQTEPMLQVPCVEWLRTKLAQIAQAKLVLLYGQERAAEMIESVKQGKSQ